MKRMFSVIAKILKRERGFTLVEMVTVVAIMGVMAAVAVPMVNSQLSKSREASYDQDQALIQTAVDSYFTAGDNVGHQGQRQFPILGARSGTTGLNLQTGLSRENETANAWDDAGTPTTGSVTITGVDGESVDLKEPTPLNPLRGTQGGEPKWMDNGDSSRNTEDHLNAEADSLLETASGWYVVKVSSLGADFAVDSRDFFIDFTALVTAGLLQAVPDSASADNGGGSSSGSYSWYVKATGAVESAFFHFPTNGTDIDGTAPEDPDPDNDSSTTHLTSSDQRGFIDGVYP